MRSNFHEGRWWMSVARGRGTLLEADDTIVSGEAVRVTCSSWRRRGKKKKKKKLSSRAREEEEERGGSTPIERNIYVYIYIFEIIFFSCENTSSGGAILFDTKR